MPKIDLQQIERGRKLNRLLSHPDFAPLLSEWDDRMVDLQHLALRLSAQSAAAGAIALPFQQQYLALKELREWMDDEIERGADELRKQQSEDLRQSHQGPAGSEITGPHRQPEA